MPSATASAASSATFWPLAATRCVSDAARKSSRIGALSASPSPSTMPRSRPLTLRGAPASSARSARRRTPSTMPGDAAPRSTRRADRARRKRGVHVARAHPRLRRRERLERPGDEQLGPDRRLRARDPATAPSAATRSPRSDTVACQPPNGVVAREVEERHALVDGVAEPRASAVRSSCAMRACASRRPGRGAAASSRPASSGRRGASERRQQHAQPGGAAASIPARARRAPRGADTAPAGSRLDVRLDRGELLRPDSRHVRQVVDRPKAAVLGAVGDDLLRRGGPDAVERLELLERRAAQADGRCRSGAAGSAPGAIAAAAAPAGTRSAARRRPAPRG